MVAKGIELIRKYFPGLDQEKTGMLTELGKLYPFWNDQINVISRKDIENLYLHHILHSLAIVKIEPFLNGRKVIDIGTGGGLPGIPLAILYPEANFTLLDSRNKKILVAGKIAEALGLNNVTTVCQRAEDLKIKFDVVLGRAVAPVLEMIELAKKITSKPAELYYWTGDHPEETKKLKQYSVHPINRFFEEDYFNGKVIVEVLL